MTPGWRDLLRDPRRRRLGLIVAACLAGLAIAYEFGQARAGYNAVRAEVTEVRLGNRVRDLERQNRVSQQQLARLETDAKVDREAYAAVERQLAQLQDKLIEQQEELAFYRGVVSGPGQGSLKVQDFVLSRGPNGTVHVRFLLAQLERPEGPVRGRLQIRVEGLRSGRLASLDLATLQVAPGAGAITFDFRYFQDIKADIRLPADFSAERVVIRVQPATRGVQPSVESFPWAVAGPDGPA